MHRIDAPRERGAGTVENLGVVMVAAILVLALVAGFASFRYADQIAAAFCRVVAAIEGGSGASCGTAPLPAGEPTDEDFQPPMCLLNETSESYSSEIKIAFVTVGENSGFIVQQYGEDGPVKLTVTDGGSLGAEGGIGAKFNIGNLGSETKAGADVDFGGGLTFGYGDTWEFESQAEYEEMREQLDTYLIQQEQLKHEGGALAIKASGGFVDAPQDPAVSFTTMGLEAGVDAGIGLAEPTGRTDDQGEAEYLDPNVGAFLSLDGSGEVITETNYETGEVSYTYQLTGGGELGAQMVAGEGSGELEGTGAFKVTRDSAGEVTGIEFKTVGAGSWGGRLGNDTFDQASGGAGTADGSSTMTTTRLEVDDDNRDVVDSWLADRGDALRVPLSAVVPDQPSDDPFEQLLYEQATMSQVEYENIRDGFAFGGAVKLGLGLGFSISAEEATATAADAWFLGAPGTDGARSLVDDTECVS